MNKTIAVLACFSLSACGTLTGIPGHGGGKRFSEEQRLVSSSIRMAVDQIDVSTLRGKRVAIIFGLIADEGGGNIIGGRASITSVLTQGQVVVPMTTASNSVDIFQVATNGATSTTSTTAGTSNNSGTTTVSGTNVATGTTSGTNSSTANGANSSTVAGTNSSTTNGTSNGTTSGTSSSTTNGTSNTSTSSTSNSSTNGSSTGTSTAVTTSEFSTDANQTTVTNSSSTTPSTTTGTTSGTNTGASTSTATGTTGGTSATTTQNTTNATTGQTSNGTSTTTTTGSTSGSTDSTTTTNSTENASNTGSTSSDTTQTSSNTGTTGQAVVTGTQTNASGRNREISVGVKYEGLGQYQNLTVPKSDAAYLMSQVRNKLLLNRVTVTVPEDPSVDAFLYVTVDVLGTNRQRTDLFLYNNEKLRAETHIEMFAINRSGRVVMPPQIGNIETYYEENYIAWTGPLDTNRGSNQGTGLIKASE